MHQVFFHRCYELPFYVPKQLITVVTPFVSPKFFDLFSVKCLITTSYAIPLVPKGVETCIVENLHIKAYLSNARLCLSTCNATLSQTLDVTICFPNPIGKNIFRKMLSSIGISERCRETCTVLNAFLNY